MDEYYCVASNGSGKFNDTSNVAVIAVVEVNLKSIMLKLVVHLVAITVFVVARYLV